VTRAVIRGRAYEKLKGNHIP
jgi:hypothetical protein